MKDSIECVNHFRLDPSMEAFFSRFTKQHPGELQHQIKFNPQHAGVNCVFHTTAFDKNKATKTEHVRRIKK